eukprot:COSAG02_NODE_7298_length_3077_cov_81.755876_2_plen_88_part_00
MYWYSIISVCIVRTEGLGRIEEWIVSGQTPIQFLCTVPFEYWSTVAPVESNSLVHVEQSESGLERYCHDVWVDLKLSEHSFPWKSWG